MAAAGIALAFASLGNAYSVLSHEAVIDALWTTGLRQALLARFPQATAEQLKEAHSYAYGGAVMQDMGYYPNGNGYFSDLTHYVRTADFIEALIADSRSLNEYAFALGALSHYAADSIGHGMGTNVGEPLLYTKLARKYGNIITYEDNPYDHLRTEYGFDVAQVAQGNYAPGAYHDFIGFNVAKELLQRAFRETYGFELSQMVNDFDKAVGSYRHALSTLIPLFTRVAWAEHQGEIRKSHMGMTKRRFLYTMSRSSYQREWGKDYDRPTFLDRLVAFLVKILPPIGELKVLKFKPLTPNVERILMKSFNAATPEYREQIGQVRRHNLHLENLNFDLGVVAGPGQYRLQDQTYAYWLLQLDKNNYSELTPQISQNILTFYRDLNAPIATRKKPKQWRKVLTELDALRTKTASLN